MAEANTKTKSSGDASGLSGFFKGVKAEFRKIIWPTKEILTKQTIAVVSISVVLGILIALIDMVLQLGINFLVK